MRHPKFILEVLSESTAREDLGPKMREYQSIDTLEEYVMLDSRKRWVQLLQRSDAGWRLSPATTAGILDCASIPLSIDLDALYDTVGIPS